jgi:uncharacterized protein with PIN domain
MAQFYADENFDYPVVNRLRVLGHDVLTVQEAGEQGGDDDHVLATATTASRIVLTFDRRDFTRLHKNNPAHAGIISCTWDPDSDALANRLDKIAAAIPSLAGQHVRVNKLP